MNKSSLALSAMEDGGVLNKSETVELLQRRASEARTDEDLSLSGYLRRR
jgi:hypothetical protein